MGSLAVSVITRPQVEIGRVVVIVDDKALKHHVATIVDFIDNKRVLVDGPSSDPKLAVPRQGIALAKVSLTPYVISFPRGVRVGTLKEIWEKEGLDAKWKESNYAKRQLQGERRKNLSDFDRFKLMKLRKQQRHHVQKALAKVKASA